MDKYQIKEGEQFNPSNCPLVISQLIALQEEIAAFPPQNKENIVVSFLKTHSINTAWIKSNPKLVDKMTFGSLAISEIEAYFESCENNSVFQIDFENYLKSQL